MGASHSGTGSAWPFALFGAVIGVSVMPALPVGRRTIAAFPDMQAPAHIHMMAATDAGGEARPTTTVKVLSCEILPNVRGKSMTTALVDFPPGAYTPRHRHPGSVMAFVLSGTLRSQLEGGPAAIFATGQAWFEPPGAIHLFAENASATQPARLLAVFVADDDRGPLTIPD